jgi:GR25 family glycosyltransferase involved in LPS biosynthesis
MLSPALRSIHDAVYVVTVSSHIDRHENTIQELGQGNFEFVYGVDKHSVTKEQLIRDRIYDEERAKALDPKNRAMNLGQICCAHTNNEIYERMLKTGIERALIFEDDVTTYSFREDEMSAAIANIPDDAEIILWGWLGGRFRPSLGVIQQAIFHVKHVFGAYKFDHRMIRNVYMRPYNEHFDIGAVNYGTYAYTITRSGAEKLLSLNRPIVLNSDHATIIGALRGDVGMYVSRKQFFGNRSINIDDPVESLIKGYS